jgi:hypothetical protein
VLARERYTETTYAIVYDDVQDAYITYVNGQDIYHVGPIFFRPGGAVIASDQYDQASQEPGIGNDLNRVNSMKEYVNNSWSRLAGETFTATYSKTGEVLAPEPWQRIQPVPGTRVVAFSTWDPGCIYGPGTAAAPQNSGKRL